MNLNPKVSIVVPVYNREKTISFCLDSILSSEFKAFEVIVVDDGSTDSTSEICKEYANKDQRIKYYYQKNSGVSVARNTGLSKCQSEWVTFVDSDDAILSSHLNVMNMKLNDSIDILMTGIVYGKFIDGKLISESVDGNVNKDVVNSNASIYLFNEFNPLKNSIFPIYNKFFKNQIINMHNIQFDTTISLGEDQIFLCNYLLYAKGICHTANNSYINIFWESSSKLSHTLKKPEEYMYIIKENYKALTRVIPIAGNGALLYAMNYGISRPISFILLKFTNKNSSRLITEAELLRICQNQIIPFLKSVIIESPNIVKKRIWVIYLILIHCGARMGIVYCRLYNKIRQLKKSIL